MLPLMFNMRLRSCINIASLSICNSVSIIYLGLLEILLMSDLKDKESLAIRKSLTLTYYVPLL